MTQKMTGKVADIDKKTFYAAEIIIDKGKISSIKPISDTLLTNENYIIPGFIDSHVHIESSMLVPSEFARLAVVHGTIATISDPHEIANVCGLDGVEFMLENGKTVPFKFYFGAPSCVPATDFETAGATLDAGDVEKLLQREEIKYLSEMMNFPGVLHGDEEVIKKIAAAKACRKPVDGHAPGLRGEIVKKYIAAGITTDHECYTKEEAEEKLKYGMKILIREGSAAKNFDALIDLLNDYPDMIMFCSDDKHPDSLALGHINQLCARAVVKGIDIFNILQAACINPIKHYKLDVGLLKVGDPADFIIVKDLKKFEVVQTFIDGILVAEDGVSKIKSHPSKIINQFSCTKKQASDFEIIWKDEKEIVVIEALDGQLITNHLTYEPKISEGKIVSDVERDILKIVVLNRYKDAPVAKGFIKNFGLKKGAMASSVAHDSHNIVAVGVDDESICRAVNLVVEKQGGISATSPQPPSVPARAGLSDREVPRSFKEMVLPLPVAGLMSNEDGYKIAAGYTAIDKMIKEELGSTLGSPFMTLSFMALLVIPHLKLSDRGLFNVDRFEFIK